MNFSRNAILLLFISLISSVSFYSQKKTDKLPLSIKANVMVLDSENKYVEEIKQENIKVFEDGEEQKITYLAEKKPILNLGIVVDNTGSMRNSLDEIIWASSFVATNLRETDEAFAVRFVDGSKIEIIEDWTNDKKSLIEIFNLMYIEGGKSAVLDAIYLSAEKLLERAKEDETKRYALLLISDVEEINSYYNFNETIKFFQDTDSQLFILSYAEQAPRKKKIAKKLSHLLSLETGGTIQTLSEKHDREELKSLLGKIIVELRSNYVICYTPTNQKRDGLPRKLSVQIVDAADGKKRNAFIREEFIVPKK